MRVAFEAPLDGSLMGVAYSDFIFAIAPMLQHDKYRFCIERGRQLGKEIWLDNGAYEGAVFSPEELHALCGQLTPDVVVAPDVIGDSKATLQLTDNFIRYWMSDPPCDARIMGVVQGEDREDRARCFHALIELGIDLFGLPLRGFQRDAEERKRFYHEYNSMADVNFHILSTSGYDDMIAYRDEPVTLDTSLPFLCAQNNMLFPCDRPDTTLDWDRDMTDEEIALAAKNLEILWYGIHLH